jgi:hypothetical protein
MKFVIPIAALIISLIGYTSVSAQQGDPPPALPDYSPNLWSEYSYPQDNIRFRFPVKPIIEQESLVAGGKNIPVRRYKRGSFMKFSMVVTDQGTRKMEENINKSNDFLDILVMSTVGTNKILREEPVSIDGHPGRFFAYETNNGFLVRGKLFVVGTKIYVAEAEVKKGEQRGPNSENEFEVPAMSFLDSIHVQYSKWGEPKNDPKPN